MEKILEVTFEPPSEKSGGGLGIKQSIISMAHSHMVDYVGPNFDIDIIESRNLKVLGITKLSHNGRLKALLNNSYTRYFPDWKNISDKIDWNEYDAIHLEFTRWPFVIKKAQEYGIPVFVRVHNVEADYFYNLWKKGKRITDFIRYYHFKKAERESVRYADKLICLTEKDKERLIQLYGKAIEEKIYINPVCIENKKSLDFMKELPKPKTKYFLITGSLWYGPNADGVIWFIQHVWQELSNIAALKDYKLYIAGAHPCEEIKQLALQNTNICLMDTPEDMEPYFKNAYCYIAPIFSGAGMKVKVAEAMMYGLPIIATSHALIGYEKSVNLTPADSEDEIKNAMIKIVSLDNRCYINERRKIYKLFNSLYSIKNSISFYNSIIDGRK